MSPAGLLPSSVVCLPSSDDLGLGGPGGDLLSRVLRRSTIGAEGFHGRVRNGIGWVTPRHDHQVLQGPEGSRRARLCAPRKKQRGKEEVLQTTEPKTSDFCLLPWIKPVERLVRLSFRHRCPSTCLLSTWWSATALIGRTRFEGGFPLRCFQRLSRPHLATRRCRWRDNRYTRGASVPVLSY